MLEFQSNARAIRRRLLNPPNGQQSSELDVVSAPKKRKLDDTKRRLAAAAEAAQQEIIEQIEGTAALAALDVAAEQEQARANRALFDGVPPSVSDILKAVCQHYRVKYIDIVSARRTATIVRPRQVVAYLAREHTTLSLPAIGRRLGGRDHTTILHAHTKIAGLLARGEVQLSTDIPAIKRAMGIE